MVHTPAACERPCLHTEILYAFFVDRGGIAISTKELQINDEIRTPEVRMIGVEGEQLGIMKLDEAKQYAYDRNVDLVLIAPTAQPPVCRAMDYGKYRFERIKKEKEAKKKQQIIKIKEVQLSCRIDTHDFDTRVQAATRFLGEGNKVRVVIRFRGREMSHMDIGRDVIARFLDAVSEYGSADKAASVEGRNMSVMISPLKAK
ncbi:MAG: translation initiation factor IF-3 [Clostridia bacterium]|nr:translation initiation factor IF-3 [Clostridia bacterium]